jgi:BirA family biotin operon repressor/biotin-[acetyl-CoA-carboxylase] ligase
MFGEKKAAGILTEMKSGPGKRYAVIGVGVNVNTQKAMFPADIALIATSLLAETGKIIAREHVLAGFINRLEPMLDLLARGGLKDIMYRYRRLAAPLMGMEARVTGAGADLCGVAEGIADDGALMVRMAGGDMARAYGGEVTFRK